MNLKKDRIGTSFGFEWAIDNKQSVSLGVQAQKLLDEREGLLPGQQLVYEGVYGSWLIRYINNLLNSDLIISSTLQGNIDGNSLLAFLSANYTITDNWAISTSIISISANNKSPLIFFDEDLRLGFTIEYSF